MKKFFSLIIFIFFTITTAAQYIAVDKDTYSAQELVEDILINSGCIEDVEITNVVGADFSDNDKSYGYFEDNGSDFPFADGVVMSTGKLAHVPGPNNGLSDDDAPGWGGDSDLEDYLNIDYTVNATIIEFDFTPNADNIHFRYIFASEEYRENEGTTCEYSDAFAFLIRPENQSNYENIAVIPGTNTPVKVTTIHPRIPGSCAAENEEYFGGFNDTNSPIIFNGQTKILTAEAQVDPGTTYHIKLVIADEQNYRYDSAVFLEGESFNIGADLGEDISGLCEGDTYTLEPEESSENPDNYEWYKIENGSETLVAEGPNEDSYEVTEDGTYRVLLDYGGSCFAEGQVTVSYTDFSTVEDRTISSCSISNNGSSIYNLNSHEQLFTQGNDDWSVTGYYLTENDAENDENPIENPEDYHSTQANQEIYVRVESESGCSTIAKITLAVGNNDYNPITLYECAEGFSSSLHFDLNDAVPKIEEALEEPISYPRFFETAEDAILDENELDEEVTVSKSELPKSVYFIKESNAGCEGLIEIQLNNLEQPKLDPTYSPAAFCGNEEQDSVLIQAGILGNQNDYVFEWETGETTPEIYVSDTGNYEVEITKPTVVEEDTLYCGFTNTIEVVESEIATIDYELHGDPNNYEVEILTSGNGTYTYAVDDDEVFSEENIFPVDPGKHILYVKDENGCGIASQVIYVVGYMQYFTPNNDGVNDTWHLLGVNNGMDPKVKDVQIYDRYGKLLTIIDAYGQWDGTFHGKNMPSNDYWFKIRFEDGGKFTGHFTLKR